MFHEAEDTPCSASGYDNSDSSLATSSCGSMSWSPKDAGISRNPRQWLESSHSPDVLALGGGGGTGNKSESLLSFSLAKRSRDGEALRRESNWELAPAARNRSLMKAMGAACAAVGEASKRNLPTMGGAQR